MDGILGEGENPFDFAPEKVKEEVLALKAAVFELAQENSLLSDEIGDLKLKVRTLELKLIHERAKNDP